MKKKIPQAVCLIFLLLIGIRGVGQTIVMPEHGDTTIYLPSYSSASVLDPGGSGTYFICNSRMTLVSTDGKPFTISGHYAIDVAHCLTVYQGPTTEYPIENYYSGSGEIKIYCYSGAVTLEFYSTPNGLLREGFNLQVCFPNAYNARAEGTNSTYTDLYWDGQNGQTYVTYFQSHDETRSSGQSSGTYDGTIHLASLASGTEYSYYIRGYSSYYGMADTSDWCTTPLHRFRTPKVQDCNSCDHYRLCIDYTDFNAEQVVCYKGNTLRPDSAVCVVDNGAESATSRHTVNTNSAAHDVRTGNQLSVIPTGDTASVRLGNWSAGSEGESILYEIHVDTNDYDLMFLRYAVVFKHLISGIGNQRPRFTIRLFDQNCQPVEPLCHCRDIVYRSGQAGWHTSQHTAGGATTSYDWRDWESMAIDLSEWHGKTLYLQLSTRDGSTSGSAYAYFTLHCGRKQIDHLQMCADAMANTFYAPEGFNYRWYNAAEPDSTLSTTRQLQVSDSGLYQCRVMPTDCNDPNCGYTINALASPRYPRAAFDYISTAADCHFVVRFVNRSTVAGADGQPLWTNEDCETALWDFGNGQSSTTYNAEATYTEPGTYVVRLVVGIAGNTCTDTITDTITLRWNYPTPALMGSTTLCPGNALNIVMLHTSSIAWSYTYGGDTYTTSSAELQLPNQNAAQTILCEMEDSNGCFYTRSIPITLLPSYHPNPTLRICEAQLPYTWRDTTFGEGTVSGNYVFRRQSRQMCDSIVTLRLTVNSSYNRHLDMQYCDYVHTFPYADSTFTTLGEHTYVFHTDAGCDSIIHLTISHLTAPRVTIYDTVYVDDPYDTLGFQVSAAETHLQGLITRNRVAHIQPCDSFTTLRLTVLPRDAHRYFSRTVCADALPYAWGALLFDSAGTQNIVYHMSNGADSTLHYTLEVHPVFDIHLYDTLCQNQSLSFGDTLIANPTPGASDIAQLLSSMHGCDSTTTLHLQTYRVYDTQQSDTLCSSSLPFVWNGTTLTPDDAGATSQQHLLSALLSSAQGCDSTTTLHLVVNPTSQSTYFDTVMENNLPRAFNSLYFTGDVDGEEIVLTNHYGCDSTIHYHLKVHWNDRGEVYDTICASQLPYLWDGTLFSADEYPTGSTASHQLIKSDTLTNASGADSVVVRRLCVRPVYERHSHQTLCSNGSLAFCDTLIASPTPGSFTLTFSLLSQHQCDSIEVLHLTVNATSQSTISDTIVENDLPHTFNGHTYGENDFDFIGHQLSLNDTILITNAAGCDSTIYYTLQVYPNQRTVLNDTVCSDALPLVWEGMLFDSADMGGADSAQLIAKSEVLSDINGADSIVTRQLLVNPTYSHHLYDTICDNATLTYADSLYSQAGDYRHLFGTMAQCDSAVTLHLSLWPTYATGYADTTCQNWDYRYGDSTIEHQVGTTSYEFMHTSIDGCDSAVTLTLTVNAVSSQTYHDTIVENQLPHLFNGMSYTDDVASDTLTIVNARGCDSTIYYTLHVHRNITTHLDSTICENFVPLVWQGCTFTDSGTDSVTYAAMHGEDSTVVLHLTVLRNTTSLLTDTVVENQLPLTWNGIVFAHADTLQATLTNQQGCDSVVSMQLHVWQNVEASADSSLCEALFPLVWNGITFDSAEMRDSTGQVVAVAKSAMLLTVHGADSLLTMTVAMLVNSFAEEEDTIFERQLPYTFNGYLFDAPLFSDTNSTTVVDGDTLRLTRFSRLDSTVTISNAAGCDSLISYGLNVVWNVHSQADSTVCSEVLPLQWHGCLFTDSVVDGGAAEGRWRVATLHDTLPAASGADSIVARHLHVMPSYANHVYDTVCESSPFAWYDDTVTVSGIYEKHFTSVDGCDSAEYLNFSNFPNYTFEYFDTICDYSGVMRLGVEYMGAAHLATIHNCDSNETYHLWGLPVSYSNVDTIISDHLLPFSYQGHLFSDTADAQMQLVLVNQYGCDSIVNFTLTVMPTVRETYDSTICQSLLPLLWDGTLFDSILYHTPGVQQTLTLIDTLHTRYGADSIVTRRLTVNPEYSLTYVDTTCNGAPYPFGDSLYNASGRYIHPYRTIAMCDSIETLLLTVNAMSYATASDTIVQNQLPYSYGGATFTLNDFQQTTTIDTLLTILNTVACDSVINYSLTMLPNRYSEHDTTLCDNQLPFEWSGITIARAGTDSTVTTMPDGTDSISRLHTTVHATYDITDTIVACDSLQWIDGITYHASNNTAQHTYITTEGCDSIRHLALTINHSAATTDSVTSCDPYTWIDSNTYHHSVGGVTHLLQTRLGCDSTVTLVFTKHEHKDTLLYDTICHGVDYLFCDSLISKPPTGIATLSAVLTTIEGCDSTVGMELNVLAPYLVRIDHSEYDCDAGTYTLQAITEAPYLMWDAFPEDPVISQHEHARQVTVRPTTHEKYLLFADYKEVPTCPSTDSVFLSPLLKPHAAFDYTPEFLTIDQPTLSLYNRSTNEELLHWWINDDDYGDYNFMLYNADVTTMPTDIDSISVMLTASHGLCHDTVLALIPFRKATIWAPNVFTPGESNNNLFFIRYIGITGYSIDLYTRGGDLVWHSNDMNDSWDGTYKGKPCPQGSYVWIIHYRDITAPRNLLSKKGTVTLLR